jgi:hypothetical protein
MVERLNQDITRICWFGEGNDAGEDHLPADTKIFGRREIGTDASIAKSQCFRAFEYSGSSSAAAEGRVAAISFPYARVARGGRDQVLVSLDLGFSAKAEAGRV